MATLSAREIAKAFGGDVNGNTASIPGPGHSREDRSLAVTISTTDPEGFTVFSHAGDDFRACRDHVRAGLGLPAFAPAMPTNANISPRPRPALALIEEPDDSDRIAIAVRLWGEATNPQGTLVETYLASRALTLPESVLRADAIRFHPSCPFGEGVKIPAMICLMRDVRTGEPRAVHRTALRTDGRGKAFGKDSKKMLGPSKGAAIMLSAFEDVTNGLNVSEGVENGLTCLSNMDAVPMWVLGSAVAIQNFPVLSGVEFLTIWADPEATGVEAADSCAARWASAGAEGVAKIPPGSQDWNALLCAMFAKGAA